MDKNQARQPPARGRAVGAKPLVTSTTGKPKLASSVKGKAVSNEPKPLQRTQSASASVAKVAAAGKVARTASTTGINKSSNLSTSVDATRSKALTKSNATPKVTASSSTTTTRPMSASSSKSSSLPPPIEEHIPTRTADPLQVAAQVYPWLYMTSTLEACFKGAEEAANKEFAAFETELAQEESKVADERVRFEAEREINFYDELGLDTFANDAPQIMQTFLHHGEACSRIEANALELALKGSTDPDEDAPLQVYREMLTDLEDLQLEASSLESSILKLTSLPTSAISTKPSIMESTSECSPETTDPATDTPRTQIIGVFTACLPVLRARIANLSMAQDLIDSAQENLSLSLRMESLGLE